MKSTPYIIMAVIMFGFFFTMVNAESLDNSDMPSSTPQGVGNGPYSYTDNTAQLQFTIPAIIAIISVVVGITIYAASRSIRK